jgi:hypothetical protein
MALQSSGATEALRGQVEQGHFAEAIALPSRRKSRSWPASSWRHGRPLEHVHPLAASPSWKETPQRQLDHRAAAPAGLDGVSQMAREWHLLHQLDFWLRTSHLLGVRVDGDCHTAVEDHHVDQIARATLPVRDAARPVRSPRPWNSARRNLIAAMHAAAATRHGLRGRWYSVRPGFLRGSHRRSWRAAGRRRRSGRCGPSVSSAGRTKAEGDHRNRVARQPGQLRAASSAARGWNQADGHRPAGRMATRRRESRIAG